ncbi:CD225/dispanin family protein [Dysgonomonas macrotermitis]|uniref:Interferon-induced transmembrane protein n=1 Tax=Dysgonomonas macrotermitis TaxID=1346286 RepID=A0A1M5ADT3_9BACT|nr:CD225/dispanin family protein [Dysgonomonas macrotermitis]SHF28246.1 Interferon-induced transmembrane protein [Dysgonomonas macrotermitis]
MENRSFTQNPNFGLNNPNDGNQMPKPNNNLPLTIIGTVLGLCSPCCIGLIVGIVAIVFSTQVESKYNYGDYQGALSSAKNAKILAFVAIGLGAIGLIYSIIQFATVGSAGMLEVYQEYLRQIQ